MSDSNIDSMTATELKEQLDALEVEYKVNDNKDTLKSLLKAALGEDDSDEAPDEDAKGGTIEIMFMKDKTNKQPVYVGVNGKSFRFRRGEWVKCPAYLLPTIQNMKKDILDEDSGDMITIQQYPYQVKGAA